MCPCGVVRVGQSMSAATPRQIYVDLCCQIIKRCVATVALWLIMSGSDCKAVRNDTTLLAGCAAVLMCWWIGGMDGCVCVSGEDSM